MSHVVHAAEALVGRTVVAAERSLAIRLGQRGLRMVLLGLRVTGIVLILAYFVFGLAVLATRYFLLPHIDDWRTDIESAASAALHAPVTVGRIDADWQGLNPRLQLWDVVLRGAEGSTSLALPQVDVVLSWTTLLAWQPRMHSMTVLAPEVEVRRLHDHRFAIAGIVIDPQAAQSDTAFVDWVLAQRYISVRDARVHFIDELAPADAPPPGDGTAPASPPTPSSAGQFDFTDVNVLLTSGLTGHHFALQLRPPSQLASLVDLRGDFHRPWNAPTARMASWTGRMFLQFDYADLARLDALTHLVPAPARIDQGKGAMRAWIDFSAMHLTRLRADVALNGVTARLAPDLQPLRLDSVQGRITQTEWGDSESQSREISLTGLRLDGPDHLHLPATDLLFRTTHSLRTRASGANNNAPASDDTTGSDQSRFEANRIVLSDWSRLAAHVPLPANWLSLIERTAARGTIEDLQALWDGPEVPARDYSLRARFSGLAFTLGAPTESSGATPAADDAQAAPHEAKTDAAPYELENLAGTVDLNQNSGSLRIDASNARMRIPVVFDERQLAFNTLSTRVRWSQDSDSRLSVEVDSFAAANEDLDLSVSGAYRGAGADAARLDLSGRLARAKLAAAPRYLPRITGAPVRAWLRGALLDGTVTEGSFYVHGDPKRFPFADPKSGEFHAALHVQDGKLDVAPRPADSGDATAGARPPRWPLLTGIDADVVFDRNHLTVSGKRAKAYGYDLSSVTARLPQLDQRDQHLFIDGQGSGPLADVLRYVVASPVNDYTSGLLAAAEANGAAQLRLKLEIPLAHAIDTVVAGSINFAGDGLILRPDIAPFSAVTGQLDFNERGIRFSDLSAGFLGGEVHMRGDTKADGTVLVQATGTATPQGTKRQVELAVLRRLLDRTRGLMRYSVSVDARRGSVGLQIDSDLVGLAADLPEPFRKASAEVRPLHIETVPVTGSAPARDTLHATLGNLLSVELQRVANANNGMRVERGAISIGAHADTPDSGLLLLVDQPHLDLDRWQKVLSPAGAPGAASAAGMPAGAETGEGTAVGPAGSAAAASWSDAEIVDLIAVHAAELTVAGKSVTNISLSAKRDTDQSWLADIDSDQASGSLHWVSARPSAPGRLTARLARLAIPERDQKQVTELLGTPPTEFPALDIVADQFELGKSKLGRLEVEAQNVSSGVGGARADTWNLQRFTLSNPDGKLTGSGSWQRDGTSPTRKMAVKVSLTFTNAGGLLARFGIPGTIRNGSGKLDGELSWRGAPFAIDYPSLAGKMHVVTEKGQFLKADAGAGRLLGVLSLQSLFRRATGDFRDIFSEGFAFDSLTANVAILNGTLTTDDFIMKGVNAVVRIKGSADLHAETQDLEVVVIPEINAGTASLAYALVNPAIGLGSFVANFLLRKPLSAAFTKIYSVTGPWADPQVQRISVESGATKDKSQRAGS